MELDGGGSPAPGPFAEPKQAPTQNLNVTPENVVALAAMFRDCADILGPVAYEASTVMRLEMPWMDDPVSRWAREQFNKYFADSALAFAKVVQAEYNQYGAMRDALVATALQYGLTEELISAGFTNVSPA